ncbi:hypothetical protein HYS48_03590, partial [Candidatus Woesearchaeota archaeon]|nr:hypothetical protein [Candidatus Woesearchaeota archaeon]
MLETSFEDRKTDYCQQRGEEVTRAAHLSPDVTVVSFTGRGNRLSYIYNPLTVTPRTNYKGEVVGGVGVIDDASFAPGVLGFDEAMRLARTMFEPLEGR